MRLDACLCLPCSLFGDDESALSFVRKPVSNWTTFNNKGKAHSVWLAHVIVAMTSFLKTQSGIQPTIDTLLSRHRQELYDLNCKRLDAIIDCLILCGRQNIALCGHHDSNFQLQVSNKGPLLQAHSSKSIL